MSGERLDVLVSRLPFTRDLPQRELVAVRIAEFRDAPEHFLRDPAHELDAGRRGRATSLSMSSTMKT